MRLLWMAVALLQLCQPARAQSWLDEPGATGSMVARIGHAALRLPPGEWRAASDSDRGTRTAHGFLEYKERILFQIQDNHVVSIIDIISNVTPPTWHSQGFDVPDSCGRNDALFGENRTTDGAAFDCLLLSYDMMDYRWRNLLWGPVIDRTAPFGGLPKPMVYAEFAKSDISRSGYVVVRVMFNPAASGISSAQNVGWASSEWKRSRLTPERIAYLNRVLAWARAYRPVVAASLE